MSLNDLNPDEIGWSGGFIALRDGDDRFGTLANGCYRVESRRYFFHVWTLIPFIDKLTFIGKSLE